MLQYKKVYKSELKVKKVPLPPDACNQGIFKSFPLGHIAHFMVEMGFMVLIVIVGNSSSHKFTTTVTALMLLVVQSAIQAVTTIALSDQLKDEFRTVMSILRSNSDSQHELVDEP